MATATNPSNARDEALAFFRESELPAGWSWVNDLSPLNLRLFAVELADAIKESVITADESHLLELLADWKATAELDAAPDVLEEVRRPKESERRPLSDFLNA